VSAVVLIVAGTAFVGLLAIILMALVNAIGAPCRGAKAAMANQMTSDPANDRALDATGVCFPGEANEPERDNERCYERAFHSKPPYAVVITTGERLGSVAAFELL